jgi:uncharacterized protein YneF (UPF0154 family)
MIYILGILLSILLGVLIGFKLALWYSDYLSKKEVEKLKLVNEDIFNQVLSNIGTRFFDFHTRLNENLIFKSSIFGLGEFDMVYNLNKSDLLLIFPDNKTYSSYNISNSLKDSIIKSIENYYSVEYNDCMTFNGNLIDLKTINRLTKSFTGSTSIDGLFDKKSAVEEPMDIDSILDKINQFGLDNLTKKERDFLKKFGENE